MHTAETGALTEIERRITRRVIEIFGLDISSLALDMTNFATYIDSTNTAAPIARRGKAKQKRSDLRLVGLGLVRLPIPHRVHQAGRRGDAGRRGVLVRPRGRHAGVAFDPRTGVLRPEVWQRWLDWDPVRMAPRYADALRSLRAVWLDAGTRDEWCLDLGAQAFRDQLRAVGLPDERVHFELFDAGHRGIDYRYPLALAWLCRQIAERSV
ncbi:MAG: hypothetical protein ACRDS1_04750 [Pseudonocardiaceae bacterium]